MAQRPIYIPTKNKNKYVKEENIDFNWFAGMSKSQKQKSIESLHNEALLKSDELGFKNILEISSKSEIQLGVELSAFNLSYTYKNEKQISVECIFQGSKVFENGGPYTELYGKTSLEAKKYEKLQTSGKLIHFKRKNERWELNPDTLFYDWIYLNTLRLNDNLVKEVLKYDAFTDIEFNPKKSINCQASSVALFVALSKEGILDKVLKDKETFTSFMETQAQKDETKLI
jgi:hypothetical protein